MTRRTNVVIVGGGVVGLSTAMQLSTDDRYQVTVLEADHVGAGSSSRSVGIVETQYVQPFDIEVRAYGHRFISRIAENSDLQLHRNGYLRLADSAASLGEFEESVARQRQFGITGARVLDTEAVRALVPFIAMDDRAGGLLGADDFYLDGYLYANLMASHARSNGAKLIQRARLVECRWTTSGAELSTSNGAFSADLVVNAAGAWAGRVGEILHAPVELRPELHHAVTVFSRTAIAGTVPSIMDYVPGHGGEGIYLRPEGSNSFFAGLHSEVSSGTRVDPDQVSLNAAGPEFVDALAEAFLTRFPGIDDAELGHGWSGLFPMTYDSSPVVGPHPTNDAVICALGSGGNGIQLSPAIGRTVVEYLRGEAPTMAGPASPWDPKRISAIDHIDTKPEGALR
ncbi:FAD-binding oxidoreductase [Hoyosella sp. YIM 151337]|uniref:NAD(P)/FAD-dependent oxidoreductase n=1 Tax=Hoyosella sp. YIM 151337 TaxID=2992742 RepID=UPI002236C175|nr:FAD-binding oxidoreductase [Hoyosella sp. YIM 151337]MCW4355209.1 FAD-binding oxidoreductase [Hoyosella sp. YIM 151337]